MEERRNDVLKKALLTIKNLKKEISKPKEPIAIIGMACRFPGGCDNIDKYWELIKDGKDSVIDIPKDRWNIDKYYDSTHTKVGKMYIKQSNFLTKNIKEFDAKFFNISPVEANEMDPQQRLLLEVCWEALENSGQNPVDLQGSKTGTFVGISSNLEYGKLHNNVEKMNQYLGTGNSASIASGRIAYLFGWNGPALSVDTACSSSLVSTLLAVESLQNGKCDMAVSAGVNLMLSPDVMSSLCLMNALSEDGRCKPFDASADGYGRGEGCGVVVLKRLSDAKRDGDRIYSIILGGAVNNDGKSSGLTVPNGKAQREVIKEALKNSMVKEQEVSYIETHGTGTVLGDPIEIRAINEAYGSEQRKKPLYIGAVKGNIGHLESAAGIAGLIKVVLCLYHKKIPKVANYQVQNPRIELDNLPIVIPTKLQEWETDLEMKRIAGISAFGFSGTNVHLIVSEGEEKEKSKVLSEKTILTLSAKDESALIKMITNYKEFLLNNSKIDIGDVAYTANTYRPEFTNRVTIIGLDKKEFIDKLEELEKVAQNKNTIYENKFENVKGLFVVRLPYNKNENETVFTAKVNTQVAPKLVFKFSANFKQMSKSVTKLLKRFELFNENYKKSLEFFEEILSTDNMELLKKGDTSLCKEKEKEIFLFSVQYAIEELLKSLGIEPEVVFGERSGSYIAAITAGIMDVETAANSFIKRLEYIDSLKSFRVYGDKVFLEKLMQDFDRQLSISAVCSENVYIVSGKEEAINNYVNILKEKNIIVEEIEEEWVSSICKHNTINWSHNKYNRAKLRYVVETKGEMLAGSFSDEILQENLEKPIQYKKSMDYLYNEGYRFFVDIGESLCDIEKSDCKNKCDIVKINLIDDLNLEESMLKALAKLYSIGVNIKWGNFYDKNFHKKVMLPNYPFAQTEYWFTESNYKKDGKDGEYYREDFGNPLEAKEIILPYKQKQFQFIFTHKNFEELVDNSGVVHMGYYLELLKRTASTVVGIEDYIVKNMEFYNAIMVFAEDVKEVLLSYEEVDGNNTKFTFYSKNKTESTWMLNVQGIIFVGNNIVESQCDITLEDESIEQVSSEKFYNLLVERGFYFGKSVKWVNLLKVSKDSALVDFRKADKHEESIKYAIGFHPGIMDSCAQTCNYLLTNEIIGNKRYMIKKLDEVYFHSIDKFDKLHAYIKKNKYVEEKDELICSIYVKDENNNSILSIKDVKLKVFDENKLWKINQMQQHSDINKDGIDVDFFIRYSELGKEERKNYLIEYVKEIIANELEIPVEDFDVNETFDVLGVDSMNGLNFYQKLRTLLNIDISFFDLMQASTCIKVCEEIEKSLLGIKVKDEKIEVKQTVEQWIYHYKKKPKAKIRLFCFPHGFGSANMYKDWQDMLGDEIDVCPIKIPGLDMERMKEKTPENIDELMETFNLVIEDSLLDLPCISFGHSWGSLFAYRLAKRLRRNPKANFVKLFVSGYTSPSLPNTSLENILDELKKIGFDHIPTNEELKELLSVNEISKAFVSAWGRQGDDSEFMLEGTRNSLPLIVSSYRLIEKFNFTDKEIIDVPIIGFHGIDDYRVTLDEMNAWEDVTTKSFKLYTMAGDHGFIDKNQSEERLIKLLKEEIEKCIKESESVKLV